MIQRFRGRRRALAFMAAGTAGQAEGIGQVLGAGAGFGGGGSSSRRLKSKTMPPGSAARRAGSEAPPVSASTRRTKSPIRSRIPGSIATALLVPTGLAALSMNSPLLEASVTIT